jgi:hypothetical protein
MPARQQGKKENYQTKPPDINIAINVKPPKQVWRFQKHERK